MASGAGAVENRRTFSRWSHHQLFAGDLLWFICEMRRRWLAHANSVHLMASEALVIRNINHVPSWAAPVSCVPDCARRVSELMHWKRPVWSPPTSCKGLMCEMIRTEESCCVGDIVVSTETQAVQAAYSPPLWMFSRWDHYAMVPDRC